MALRAKVTKAKKKAILPVPEPVAKRLRPKLARLAATDRLWPGSWKGYGARMLRPDLEEAEIPYADENGKLVDFHALRHSAIFFWASNPKLTLAQVQHLARHATPMMTAQYYAHHEPEVLAQLLDRGDPSGLAVDSSSA